MLHQTRVYALTCKSIHVLSTDKENINGQIFIAATYPYSSPSHQAETVFFLWGLSGGCRPSEGKGGGGKGVHPDPEITTSVLSLV